MPEEQRSSPLLEENKVSYIQQWMIIVLYKFHPESDSKNHPILKDDNFFIIIFILAESDDK